MDPRERIKDDEEAFRTAVEGLLAKLWTALPGIVTKVNANNTVEVQPTIMGEQQAKDGSWRSVKMPLCVDVPIVFQRGGGVSLTFPVEVGDEALVVFSSRCHDGWWASGGIQVQAEVRMHDLSDGFAFIGPRSAPNALESISQTSAQLRTDDGSTYVEVDKGQVVNVVAPQGMTITAPFLKLTGYLAVENINNVSESCTFNGNILIDNGNVTTLNGDVMADSISLKNHVHTGVQPGLGDSGGPVG